MVARLARTNGSTSPSHEGSSSQRLTTPSSSGWAAAAWLAAVPLRWLTLTPLARTNGSTVAVARGPVIAAAHDLELERVARGR